MTGGCFDQGISYFLQSERAKAYFYAIISCGNLRHDSLFTEVSGQPTIDLNR